MIIMCIYLLLAQDKPCFVYLRKGNSIILKTE